MRDTGTTAYVISFNAIFSAEIKSSNPDACVFKSVSHIFPNFLYRLVQLFMFFFEFVQSVVAAWGYFELLGTAWGCLELGAV